MGKMIFDISCEISVSPELLNRFEQQEQQFMENTDGELKMYFKTFGDILDFTNEAVDKKNLKIFCKINVSPELVMQFEKWDKWEFVRMMDGDLRLTLMSFGEILDFKNGINYELD